jgi:hypothetical protein
MRPISSIVDISPIAISPRLGHRSMKACAPVRKR